MRFCISCTWQFFSMCTVKDLLCNVTSPPTTPTNPVSVPRVLVLRGVLLPGNEEEGGSEAGAAAGEQWATCDCFECLSTLAYLLGPSPDFHSISYCFTPNTITSRCEYDSLTPACPLSHFSFLMSSIAGYVRFKCATCVWLYPCLNTKTEFVTHIFYFLPTKCVSFLKNEIQRKKGENIFRYGYKS